jgi:SAM-dependent methyltransferase
MVDTPDGPRQDGEISAETRPVAIGAARHVEAKTEEQDQGRPSSQLREEDDRPRSGGHAAEKYLNDRSAEERPEHAYLEAAATVAPHASHVEVPEDETGHQPHDRDYAGPARQTHDNADLPSLSALSHISTGLSIDSDADSAMGDMSSPLSTTSLRSSIYEFVEEHGRTFHRYKEGKYWMPNDQLEQERLDLQHSVFMMLLKGRLGLAPIQNPQSVLDLGTGTGIWAIDFAHLYPTAEVLGTDLSPIQPDYVPANCRFEVDDAEDDWIYSPSRRFDYVHLRLMFHTFTNHRRVIDSAMEHLRPGGWMEWQDYYAEIQCIDDTMKGSALERWSKLYIEGGKNMGRDMLAPRRYKSMMEAVGFVNVTEERLVIPGNAWPKGKDQKKMGLWQMTNFLDGIHAVTMTVFTKGLGMSREEVEILLVDVRNDIKNLGVHFYFLTYFVYGQKPETRGKGKRSAS